MKNYIQRGHVLSAIAPYPLASGEGAKIGTLFGVACGAALAGASVELCREGVFELAAVSADAGGIGAKVYWNDTERRITTTANGNLLVGALVQPKSSLISTAQVLLDGAVR